MIKPTECLLVMGRRGCGKSHLAKRLQDLWPRRIILDALNEYTKKEYPDAYFVKDFETFCQKLVEFKQNKLNKFVLIFQTDPDSDISEELFNQILRISYFFGDIQIVIEEIQLYSSPHLLPKWLKNCLLIGRHQKLSLLFTTQRPGMLNKTILSQCAHVFCGQLIDGNDINYVSGFLKEHANQLTTLPERRFIYFSEGKIKIISNDL